jgi:hypothetical protein
MEPNGFLGYTKRGNACELNNFGMNNTPPIAQTKIIEPMVLIAYPKKGNALFLNFGMAIQCPSKFQ